MGILFDRRPSVVAPRTAGDAPKKKKEHRQLTRVKQLFAHRTQKIKNIYGPSVDLGHVSPFVLDVERSEKKQKRQTTSTAETPLSLSEEQLSVAAGQYPATFGRHPHFKSQPPGTSEDELHKETEPTEARTDSGAGKRDLDKLMATKKALSEELRFAQATADRVNQIVSKNSQLKEEKREIEAMKETLAAAMAEFATMKRSLVLKHKDMEKECMDLVGPEATEEKVRIRMNLDALRDLLTSMGCDQKRLRAGFQEQFKALAGEFQYVRKEMEVSGELLRERRQKFREYQELARNCHTLAQRISYMEKMTRVTRNQIQQVQASLVANQEGLTEARQEKGKLESERDSMEAEWSAEQQVWGIEKRAMEEDFRNHMGSKDRERMEEREEFLSQKQAMTADLFVAQNRAEDLDDELTYTKTLTEEERAALTEKETTLENSEEENAALKELFAQKVQSIVDFKKSNKAKDEEIRKLRRQVRKLRNEVIAILREQQMRFTLQGILRKHFWKKLGKDLEKSEHLLEEEPIEETN